jgi:hypothetical protein
VFCGGATLTNLKEIKMGYDSPDPFYQPEKFNLTQVAMIDYSDGQYQFDYRVVWRHEDGTLYTARDTGCSCPSPFENYHTLEDLEVANIPELIEEARSEGKVEWYDGDSIADFVEELRTFSALERTCICDAWSNPEDCSVCRAEAYVLPIQDTTDGTEK